MQTNSFLRALAALAVAGFLAGCSAADNPYAAIEHPPLLKATLHTITYQVPDRSAVEGPAPAGFTLMPPAPNYPGAVRVEAALWKVPEDVAAAPVVRVSSDGKGFNQRYLIMAPTAPAGPVAEADSKTVVDFYARVLGDVVTSRAGGPGMPELRIHSLTYTVEDILAAKNKLREAGIPITFSPVAITTAYLGDHKLLGITAPDGVIIELVETAAQ